MAKACKIMLFNAEPDEARNLRALIQAVPGSALIAEVDDISKLASAVAESPIDALLVNLDPDPYSVIDAMAELLSQRHEELAVITTGVSAEADLLLLMISAGIQVFLPKPVEPQRLIDELRPAGDRPPPAAGGKVIAVLGAAGGVGATTVATNLAIELGQLSDKRVVLFDLNFLYGQAAIFLDLLPTYTISDVMIDPKNVDRDLLEKAVCKMDEGVDVLTRPHHFEQAESLDPAQMLNVINLLQRIYPYVVLDGPHGFGKASRQVLQMADHVLLLMQLTVPALRNVSRIFQEYERHNIRLDALSLIVNRMGIYKDLDIPQAEKTLNKPILTGIPDDWPTVRDAIDLGEPLLKAAPRSKVRQAIEALANWVHTGKPVDFQPETRKGGALARLFGKG